MLITTTREAVVIRVRLDAKMACEIKVYPPREEPTRTEVLSLLRALDAAAREWEKAQIESGS